MTDAEAAAARPLLSSSNVPSDEFVPNDDKNTFCPHPITQTLASDDCDNLPITVTGYQRSWARVTALFIVSVMTLGLYRLITSWFPKLYTWSTSYQSPLVNASHVLVTRSSPTAGVPELLPVTTDLNDGSRNFDYHHLRYSLDPRKGHVVFSLALSGLSISPSAVSSAGDGLSAAEAETRTAKFGRNVMLVEIPSLVIQVLTLLLHPIYAFQIFSIIFWASEEYEKYSMAIGALMIIAIWQQITTTRQTLRSLNSLAATATPIVVRRNGIPRAKVSTDLVPGDVIHLRQGLNIPCDMVLLSGQATVNEAMLTGEATPIVKSPYASTPPASPQTLTKPFDPEADAPQSALWAGTTVVQVTPPPTGERTVRALVLRTGFATRKGALLRAMLYPKPSDFAFMSDSIKFLAILLCVAIAGFIIVVFQMRAVGVDNIVVYLTQAGDLLTVVIPPALPISMTIGTSFAISRLKSRKIMNLNPDRINVAGKVRFVAFDKTGTLTEDGLDMVGVAPAAAIAADYIWPSTSICPEVVDVLATAHALTLMKPPVPETHSSPAGSSRPSAVSSDSEGGEQAANPDRPLVGDPLDVTMFGSTRYVVCSGSATLHGETWADEVFAALAPGTPGSIVCPQAGSSGRSWLIARRLDFNPQLARMSVVAVAPDNSVWVHTKGAPERVLETCDPVSIPEDTATVLEGYTRQGYRVLALAARHLSPTDMTLSQACAVSTSRSDLERNFTFVGLLLLHNKIKDDSPDVIAELRAASLRTAMVTGDYPLTAAYVATACSIMAAARPVYLSIADKTGAVAWKCIAGPKDMIGSLRSTDEVLPINGSLSDDDAVETGLDASTPELVVTGTTWSFLYDAAFPDGVTDDVGAHSDSAARDVFVRIAVRASVFARFTPTQKAQLMEVSQSLGYFGMMCGDGANDCPALAAAHVGVSLSEAEASVAAPFTSQSSSVDCTVAVIREGRAALVTSFQCFKYMAMYSIIQTVSMVLLFSRYSNLGDSEFLFIDLGLIIPLGTLMGRIPAAAGPLSSARPHGRLTSHYIVLSLIGQSVLSTLFQAVALLMLINEPWYEHFVPEPGHEFYISVPENATVFFMSVFQYVLVVISFSVAAPHRRAWWKIPAFAWSVALLMVACLFVLVRDVDDSGSDPLELTPLPWSFRLRILGLVFLYGVCSFVWERAVVVAPWYRRWRQTGKKVSTKPYKVILSELSGDVLLQNSSSVL